MTDDELSRRTGTLMREYSTAKQKVQVLRLDAEREAKVLDGIVRFLAAGGKGVEIPATGMPLETYLSVRVAKMVNGLSESLQEKERLQQTLTAMGYSQAD